VRARLRSPSAAPPAPTYLSAARPHPPLCACSYPAHATFGGYKESGFGRETHLTALSSYQQTKNMLVSTSTKALGFF